ncbi:class I SAM-dependent methyltransferase [Citrifermentans bremense]|uniref:class I SAM-dependent methyltransferase n=1 Tax=Citrifermentans bremense TaxID=60035 RepID=UPI0003FD851E|nr:class I SAM-dependent methyltransferase [Citrifermentans bremense]
MAGVNCNAGQVTVPIYELDAAGNVKPNPLFHRPVDLLHSRCVEYPFAAWQLAGGTKVLDVGTVKADKAWHLWLEQLPIEVHATDYDEPYAPFENVTFHRADLRDLPFQSDSFDRILAVSVIEHIGLADPQVVAEQKPEVDPEGDLNAFKELLRVLAPGGLIVMTFPFGLDDKVVLGSARTYTGESIGRFNGLAQPVRLDYYEYQYAHYQNLCAPPPQTRGRIAARLFPAPARVLKPVPAYSIPELPGQATWRKIPMEDAQATNETHIEGVLCGVWRKS